MTKIFLSTPTGQTHSFQIDSYDTLKNQIFNVIGIPEEYQNFHYGGRQIPQFQKLEDYTTITLFLKLQGGKGGFGSLLRNQAQTRRKITNWDHSRDREGRRIGNVKNENNLIQYFKRRKEEESKIQKEIQEVKVMQNTIKQAEVDIKLDQSYKNKLEKTEKMIEKSVLLAKQKKSQKNEQKQEKKLSRGILDQLDEIIKEIDEDNEVKS